MHADIVKYLAANARTIGDAIVQRRVLINVLRPLWPRRPACSAL